MNWNSWHFPGYLKLAPFTLSLPEDGSGMWDYANSILFLLSEYCHSKTSGVTQNMIKAH